MLPDKPRNMPMPISQISSGTELSKECGGPGEIQQSEAGKGLDQAIRKIDSGRKSGKDETVFKSSTTNQGTWKNGPAGLPLLSAAGEKLAKKSAPRSAFVVAGKIQSSSADRFMRGGKQ